jgi:hypothetical protein
LIPQSDTFYGIINKEFQKIPVSNVTEGGATQRPSLRVPFRVQGAAAIQQGTGDGDLLPQGSGSVYGSFTVSPVWHYAAGQATSLAVAATKGKNRGKVEYQASELQKCLDSAMAGLEGVVFGDGSGLLSIIPTTSTIGNAAGPGASITGQGLRAMAVTDNQVVQFFPAEGGASRGFATVNVTSPQTSTIYFVGQLTSTGGVLISGSNLTSNVVAGDYIMLYGATGAAPGTTQTSVLGTQAWNSSATTGSIAGYNRALYPTRISTPTINLLGGAVQASLSQRIEMILRRTGISKDVQDSGWYLFPEDQAYAVAQTNYYNKQLAYHESTSAGSKGSVPDFSYKNAQDTFGGRKVKISTVQPTGRIDLILSKNWIIAELFELRLHDYGGGSTVVPQPGAGSYYNALQYTYEAAFNLVNSAPLQGLVVVNAQAPYIS